MYCNRAAFHAQTVLCLTPALHNLEWLRHLLEPALAATLDNDPAATAAASAALTALANLEGLAPGSLQTMMLEVSLHHCNWTSDCWYAVNMNCFLLDVLVSRP